MPRFVVHKNSPPLEVRQHLRLDQQAIQCDGRKLVASRTHPRQLGFDIQPPAPREHELPGKLDDQAVGQFLHVGLRDPADEAFICHHGPKAKVRVLRKQAAEGLGHIVAFGRVKHHHRRIATGVSFFVGPFPKGAANRTKRNDGAGQHGHGLACVHQLQSCADVAQHDGVQIDVNAGQVFWQNASFEHGQLGLAAAFFELRIQKKRREVACDGVRTQARFGLITDQDKAWASGGMAFDLRHQVVDE